MPRQRLLLDMGMGCLLFAAVLVYERTFFFDNCYGFGDYGLDLSDGLGIFHAAQVVHDGGIVGRDLDTFWGPWAHHYHAAILKLFGNRLTSLKLATILADAAFAVVVYILFRKVAGVPLAFVLAAVMPLFNQHFRYCNHGYVSFYTLALGWAAFLCLVVYDRRERVGSLLAMGLLAGLAYGLKFSFALYIICGLATLLYVRRLLAQDDGGASRWPGAIPQAAFPLGMLALSVAALWFGVLWLFPLPLLLCAIVLGVLGWRRPLGPAATWGLARELAIYGAGFLVPIVGLFAYHALHSGAGRALDLMNPIGRAVMARGFATQFCDVPRSVPDLLSRFSGVVIILAVSLSGLIAAIEHRLEQRREQAPPSPWAKPLALVRTLALAALGLGACKLGARWLGERSLLDYKHESSLPLLWALWWSFPFALFWMTRRDPASACSHRLVVLAALFGTFLMLCNYPGVNEFVNMWGSLVAAALILLSFLAGAELPLKRRVLFPLALFACCVGLFALTEWNGIRKHMIVRAEGKTALLDPDVCDVYTEKGFARDMQALKQYVRARVRPDEEILAACAFPGVYCLTGRGNRLPQKVFWKGENYSEAQRRAVAYLESHPVRLVVCYMAPRAAGFGNTEELEVHYPILYNHIREHYVHERSFGLFGVFLRRSAAPGTVSSSVLRR